MTVNPLLRPIEQRDSIHGQKEEGDPCRNQNNVREAVDQSLEEDVDVRIPGDIAPEALWCSVSNSSCREGTFFSFFLKMSCKSYLSDDAEHPR